MANTEYLQELMGKVGPLIDGIELIEQEGEDHWLIFFGEMSLHIDNDPEGRKLVFWTDLGEPTEENRHDVYDALLAYNALWTETGGVRMAIDQPGGSVLQVFDLFTLDLDVSTLVTVVENLLEKAEYWKGLISESQVFADQPLGESPPEEPDSMGPAIRV